MTVRARQLVGDLRAMPHLATREEYWKYFEGWQLQAWDTDANAYRTPVVKSFLVETVGSRAKAPDPHEMLTQAGVSADRVDETLFRVTLKGKTGVCALAEAVDSRFLVFYTTLPAQWARRWLRSLVNECPWLDRVWLSAPVFNRLWRYVHECYPKYRYVRLTFAYDARYEAETPDELIHSRVQADANDDPLDQSLEMLRERRSSKCTLIDRVGEIETRLDGLRKVHRPFCSIVQLRVPAPGRGGHDFYFDGQVTNRSDNFTDHRTQLMFVLDLYRRSTEQAESILWTRLHSEPEPGGRLAEGAPILLKFEKRLPADVFRRWVDGIFGRRNNVFRLWGHPLNAGPDLVHVYGVDRHLWQRIYLEFAPDHLLAFLPEGTCGNTVHRLVTNVQRFVDPGVKAWVGDLPYDVVVGATPAPGGR